MRKVIILDKKEGKTPLAALEDFRFKNKAYKDMKMTYAGRLDPMASGVLLILAGEETKNKEKYLALHKEYDFEVLFGVATDTHDILGKVVVFQNTSYAKGKLEKEIRDNLKFFTGKFIQKYPIYSSKAVKGKQLFQYAREGKEVDIPGRKIFIRKLRFLKLRKINGAKLLANIEKRIEKVKGDFRQKEILKIWRQSLTSEHRVSTSLPEDFYVGSFKVKCSSGTYVRGVIDSLGKKMNIPALAFSIKRTKVGKFAKMQ